MGNIYVVLKRRILYREEAYAPLVFCAELFCL